MIFDTNVFIYADRGVLSAKQLILDTPNRAISAVTYMEYVPSLKIRETERCDWHDSQLVGESPTFAL